MVHDLINICEAMLSAHRCQCGAITSDDEFEEANQRTVSALVAVSQS
jgi:hypothetical protein